MAPPLYQIKTGSGTAGVILVYMVQAGIQLKTVSLKPSFPRKKGWKNCSVTVQTKAVAVSSAIGSYVYGRVDIYEYGNVFALINNPQGDYPVSADSPASDRKLINSRPLVRYLKEKCGRIPPRRLNAWLDGGIVLFCIGTPGKEVRFHDGFKQVTDVLRLRYDNSVKVDGRRFIISASLSEELGDRLSAYKHDKMYAFFNDKNGVLKTEARNEFGTKAVRAEGLIRMVEKELGKGPWYGVVVPNGIVFSGDARIDKKPVITEDRFIKINFPLFVFRENTRVTHA